MIRILPVILTIIFCHHAVGNINYKIERSNYEQFYELYKDLKSHEESIFISADGILHTFHLLYDYSLRDVEANHLVFKLDTLLNLMVKRSEKLIDNYGEPAEKNMAYFSVANKLLNPDCEIEQRVAQLVADELELIRGHKGFAKSPIFGTEEDYSQFVPRGHYTTSPVLRRYFMAMIYLGRMGFYLKPREVALAKPHVARALLIVEILDGDAYRLWKEIYEITDLYVGKSDDLGPPDFRELLKTEFPDHTPADIIEDEEKLAKFIQLALELRRPRIISTYTQDDRDAYLSSMSFKFIGQRFIPDGYIFQNLVYDKVGTRGEPRLFPRGLDLAAVLGSKRAERYLIHHYHEDRYLNYKKQFDLLKGELRNLPEDQWQENLYWGWLAVMKDLLKPLKSGPEIFRTDSWADKTLITTLAFWAELRHDAILYAKQSYTVAIVSIEKPKKPVVYIEPKVKVYVRLRHLLTMLPMEYLSPPLKSRIVVFEKLLERLALVAEQELEGKRIKKEDMLFFYDIGKTLENISLIPAGKMGEVEADKSVEMIADVHTDVNTNKVLEVAVGGIDIIKVTIEGKRYAGGVFSYYEFLQPIDKRLNDEQWQEMAKPERPSWQRDYLSPD